MEGQRTEANCCGQLGQAFDLPLELRHSIGRDKREARELVAVVKNIFSRSFCSAVREAPPKNMTSSWVRISLAR
jgi:hypothetical protein